MCSIASTVLNSDVKLRVCNVPGGYKLRLPGTGITWRKEWQRNQRLWRRLTWSMHQALLKWSVSGGWFQGEFHLIQRSPKLPKGGGPSFCILGDCCFDPLMSSQFDPSSPTGSPPRHEASPLVNTLAKWLPMTRTFPWPVLSSEVGYLHETWRCLDDWRLWLGRKKNRNKIDVLSLSNKHHWT